MILWMIQARFTSKRRRDGECDTKVQLQPRSSIAQTCREKKKCENWTFIICLWSKTFITRCELVQGWHTSDSGGCCRNCSCFLIRTSNPAAAVDFSIVTLFITGVLTTKWCFYKIWYMFARFKSYRIQLNISACPNIMLLQDQEAGAHVWNAETVVRGTTFCVEKNDKYHVCLVEWEHSPMSSLLWPNLGSDLYLTVTLFGEGWKHKLQKWKNP